VQLGSGRAGTYTYDWIDNLFGLDMHSANVILPQFLDLQLGDAYPFGSGTLQVEALEPGRLVVTRVPEWNWVRIFCLIGDGDLTRLLLRNRMAIPAEVSRPAVPPDDQRVRGLLMEPRCFAESNSAPRPRTSGPTGGPASLAEPGYLAAAGPALPVSPVSLRAPQRDCRHERAHLLLVQTAAVSSGRNSVSRYA